ncbi:MAG: histidine kinase [Bacteroidales bacterium]|nr:histidine kinase [Bacteroidales bacterium]
MTNNFTKRKIWGHIRDLLIVVLIGDIVTIFFDPNLENFFMYFWWNSLYSLFIGGFLWKGNEAVGYLTEKRVNGKKEPARALRWNLSGMFIYSTIAIFFVNYVWWILIFNRPMDYLFKNGFPILAIQMAITILIASVLYSINFFKAWRESAVNEERLQKESIKLQYKALKNQVNPHFLFNSLNSLTTLVYRDQGQAAKFIKQLSDVYRYILEHKDNELVTVQEEINFAKKYIYLQKIRHGESLQVDIQIKDFVKEFVVPVSIQILIENAIKHNEVSEENPLKIEILRNGEYIMVKNNLQPKRVLKDSGGIGLSTIRKRYSFLTKNAVITMETDNKFLVKVPVLEENKS